MPKSFWFAVSGPRAHKCPPFFEGITTPVGLFGFVADDMRQSALGDFARKMRFVAGPIAKAAAKAVYGNVLSAQAAHDFGHRHMRERLSAAVAGKNKLVDLHLGELFQDCKRSIRKWNAVFSPGFHARRRNDPDTPREVDFGPSRAIDFAGASGRQNRKLESARRDRVNAAQSLQEGGKFVVAHRRMMPAS